MTRPAKQIRRYEPKKMRPAYAAMARARVFQNLSNKALAERFGYHESYVATIVNCGLFKAEERRLKDFATDKEVESYDPGAALNDMQEQAVAVIAEELYNAQRSPQRSKMALSILDRTGFAPKQFEPKQDNRRLTIINYAPLPGEDPKEANERLEKLRAEAIEVEKKDEDILSESI